MKVRFKLIIIFILIATGVLQIYLNKKTTENIENKQKTEVIDKYSIKNRYIDLSQITSEINNVDNATILSANKENDRWSVEIKISGNKNELMKAMKKLEKYEIKNYILNKNNNENCVIIDVYGNE
ncbi:hypothetical protein [uncultured Clostridium sp.]|uniref:hypothetical protein n=1 Tax=uncultured Clostridium sp. TaxID=59620 RepID=UPI0025F6BEC1|nr:hypothetical protein [uncultured Clostridium sp.]